MDTREAILDYLRADLVKNGHGRLYDADELAAAAEERGVLLMAGRLVALLRQDDGIKIRYRGGNTNQPISFDTPNREATLRQVDESTFSFDTELAVQTGLQRWFQANGFVAKQEVPDAESVISGVRESRSVSHLPDVPTSRSTKCRDIMAHAPDRAEETFHIVEAKGRTQVEPDLYGTFGQIFPIADPEVTRGWTNKDVPKHGLCLKYARRFLDAWSGEAPGTRITLVVAVPDLVPAQHDVRSFYNGRSLYYPKQAEMYARFLRDSDIGTDHTFARLLRHLRDTYQLLEMADQSEGIKFRFWGYQGLQWVRDFATNQPVALADRT